jgi:hypothetical protein
MACIAGIDAACCIRAGVQRAVSTSLHLVGCPVSTETVGSPEADGRTPRAGLHHLGVKTGKPAGDPRAVAGRDREREIEVQVRYPRNATPRGSHARGYDRQTRFESHPGDVLVHPEAFLGALGDVARSGFSVRRFLDLCGAIEACVLNERLVTVITPEQGRVLVHDNPFAYRIIAEDFVVLPEVKLSPGRVLAVANAAWDDMDTSSPDAFDPDDPEERHRVDARSSTLEAVVWEELLGVPLVPTVQQAATYVDNRGLAYRQWLHVKYEAARGEAFRVRLAEDLVSHLPVPPIALMILSSCEAVEEIPSRLLAARSRLERLRKIASELDELSRSGSVAPAAKKRERERLEAHWRKEVDAVLGPYRPETVVGIRAATQSLDAYQKLTSASLTSPQFWINLRKVGASTADWLRRAPFRPLGSAIRTSLETPSDDINRIVRRLFDYELTVNDRRRAVLLTQSLETSLARQVAHIKQHDA